MSPTSSPRLLRSNGPAEVVRLTPEFKQDAPAHYDALRARGSIHPAKLASGLEALLVVGYDAARAALTHPALLKDSSPSAAALAAAGYTLNQPGIGLGGGMLEADPPDHTRLRFLASLAFTPRRTQLLAPRIQTIADTLIDALAPAGETDLVASFTGRLPITVIAELLGIPEEQRSEFRVWTSRAISPIAVGHREALVSLHRMLGELVEGKRRAPQDDLLSALVCAHDEDDNRLSQAELIGTALVLAVAGHETTVNLLGNSLMALFSHPEQTALLRQRPELMPTAIEEFLRYDTSVEYTTLRYAAEDLVLDGWEIPRGSVVVVVLHSAGRDTPLAPGEDPRTLDVTRRPAPHLAFGYGIHHCLGAPLARLEAATALGTLLRRIPDLELAVPAAEVAWVPGGMMRGPLSLPVRFAPQRGAHTARYAATWPRS